MSGISSSKVGAYPVNKPPACSFCDCSRSSKDVRVYPSLHRSNANRGGYFDQGGTQGADTASQESSPRDGVVGVSFQQFLRGAVESKVRADGKSSTTRGTKHAFIKHGKLFYRQLKHLESTRRVCFRCCHEGTPLTPYPGNRLGRFLRRGSFPHRFCLAN